MRRCGFYFYLIFPLSLILGGCEGLFGDIDRKNIHYQRTGDNLHIYQDGDFIDYEVRGTDPTNNSISGTMRTEWHQRNITEPGFVTSPQVITTLAQTTTLTIDTGTHTSTRYISQDSDDVTPSPTLGTVYLHAYADPTAGSPPSTFYWVNSKASSDPDYLTSIDTITLLQSPLTQHSIPPPRPSHNYLFNVFNGCDIPTTCDSRVQFMDTAAHVYNDIDTRLIETPFGSFSDLSKITVTEIPLKDNASTEQPVLLNAFGFCDTVNMQPVINGNIWIHPAIGIVVADFNCFGSSGQYHIEAYIRNTNIDPPPSTGG